MHAATRFGTIVLIGSLLSAAVAEAGVTLPTGQVVEKVDFERHVVGLFGRMGCNMGSCHGSFQGKGGLRLSLFGFDPDKDFIAVTRDNLGRRVVTSNPEESLLLLKAAGLVEHQGGVRFQKDSWQYQILRDWIQQGTNATKGSGDVKQMIVSPPELAFAKAGAKAPIQVKALFADGSEFDVTCFCDFRTNDDAVADVTNLGLVTARQPGNTAIVVNYRGNVVPVRVLIQAELPKGLAYPKVPEVNFVDREVFSRLRQLNMIPSDLTSDEEFLRRVSIDTIGSLPSPKEIRDFLADKSADKRAKKIDELLAHPLHAAMWATKFSDVTGNDTVALEQPNALKAKRSQQWHDWLRKRFQDNVPYDQMVRGIITATSREGKSPEEWIEAAKKLDVQLEGDYATDYAQRETLDLYWRRAANQTNELWAERTAAAFLGVRLECAQCHKHPFDRWSQVEYRQYANLFSPILFGSSPETKKLIDAENAERKAKNPKNNNVNLIRELVIRDPKQLLTHPDTGAPLTPKAPAGPEIPFEKGQDPRVPLFNWLKSPDNPFFARAFVNRVWGHYFGQGIVNPVDDFSLGNPPSNDKLLDALAKEFLAHNFDIRHMERLVLNSRTYQLSSKVNETNRHDKNNFAHAYVRPMMAEAVVDVLNSALGSVEKFGPEVRPGSKAVEVGASLLQNPALNYAFRIFGRPPRTTACDCERTMEPALPQKLFLMTDATLLAKFNEPDGRINKLLRTKLSDGEILDELFLATLSRMPSTKDRASFAEYRQTVPDRRQAFNDTLWALINTREFILNH